VIRDDECPGHEPEFWRDDFGVAHHGAHGEIEAERGQPREWRMRIELGIG
jgi:hypothetical protein